MNITFARCTRPYPWTKVIFRLRCGAWRTYVGGALYAERVSVMAGPTGRLP